MIIKSDRLYIVKSFISKFVWYSFILEVLFYPKAENIFASLVMIYGWFIINNYVLTSKNMISYPISFLMIFGLAIIHYVLPIPLTIIEFKPVTFNLKVPYLTFFHQFLYVSVIVCTHHLYVNLFSKKNILSEILKKNNFYLILTNNQIWLTSLLALMSGYYKYFVYGVWESGAEDRGLMFYVAGVFTKFIWMPTIIPLINNGSVKKKKQLIYVLIYCSAVVLLAIASNVRTLLFSGIFIVVFVFLIYSLYGRYNLSKNFSRNKLILYSVLFVFISGPLVDFSFAMVSVRSLKYNLSGEELLYETLELYKDKDRLKEVKLLYDQSINEKKKLVDKWDEEYLGNSLSNRFCNLKISDNCLYYAGKIGYANSEMQTDFLNQIKAIFPNVMVGFLGMSPQKKKEVAAYSITDYMYSLAINNSNVRGSFIVGSIPGLGMSIFGYTYLLVIIPLFIIIFLMFDSMVYTKNGQIFFSYLFYIKIFTIVNYFNDRHFYQFEFRYVLRTYLEGMLMFILVMNLIRGVEKLLKKV